jgi:pimeloyl-ACP methyl ester carboxylesterase
VSRSFVLVHGSWHGAWCWDLLAPLLRAAGCGVLTPDLTMPAGSANAACRLSLDTHIGDVVRALGPDDGARLVLVGHSYAGMVITGAAARVPERIALLVYLDAYLPGDGQSLLDLWAPDERAAALHELAHGAGLRPAPTPAELGIMDPARAAWVEAKLRPHPLSTYAQAVAAPAAVLGRIPRAYVHCTRGPTAARFAPFGEAARRMGWPVRELAAGHDAMIGDPQATASMLLELAGRVAEA